MIRGSALEIHTLGILGIFGFPIPMGKKLRWEYGTPSVVKRQTVFSETRKRINRY